MFTKLVKFALTPPPPPLKKETMFLQASRKTVKDVQNRFQNGSVELGYCSIGVPAVFDLAFSCHGTCVTTHISGFGVPSLW